MKYYSMRHQAVEVLKKMQRKGINGRIRYTYRSGPRTDSGWWIEVCDG